MNEQSPITPAKIKKSCNNAKIKDSIIYKKFHIEELKLLYISEKDLN